MSDQTPAKNPPWEEDKTVADSLGTAADFIGSEKTRQHTLSNLRQGRRVIYTVEFFRRNDGTVNMVLLVNAANTIVTRNGLLIDADGATGNPEPGTEAPRHPTPAATLSDPRR
jgi:hypothetical protein